LCGKKGESISALQKRQRGLAGKNKESGVSKVPGAKNSKGKCRVTKKHPSVLKGRVVPRMAQRKLDWTSLKNEGSSPKNLKLRNGGGEPNSGRFEA